MSTEKRKTKISVDVSFLHYGSRDTETVEFRSNQTFLEVILQNKTIRGRLIAFVIVAFVIYVIL